MGYDFRDGLEPWMINREILELGISREGSNSAILTSFNWKVTQIYKKSFIIKIDFDKNIDKINKVFDEYKIKNH